MGPPKRQRKKGRSNLPAIESDQLGPFAPGTVLWVLTHAAPIWPARVLGYAEACIDLPKRRVASLSQLRRLRDGSITGAAVRFFGDHSVSYIAEGMGLPFVPAAISVLDWVWKATKIDGLGRGWSAVVYSNEVKQDWRAACRDAVVHWRRRLGGRDEDTNAYAGLAPGTLVWGLCQDSPFWPGRIATQHDIDVSGATGESPVPFDWHVPVVFCGRGAGFAWMSLGDLALYLPGFEWRGWMRARGEAEGRDRDWPDVKIQEWSKWQDACVDAEQEFSLVHSAMLTPPGRPLGPPGSASHASGGGGRQVSSVPGTSPRKRSVPFQILPGRPRLQQPDHVESEVCSDDHRDPQTFESRAGREEEDQASHAGSVDQKFLEPECPLYQEGNFAEPSTEYCLVDSDVEEYDKLI